jgi:hypothetical protein
VEGVTSPSSASMNAVVTNPIAVQQSTVAGRHFMSLAPLPQQHANNLHEARFEALIQISRGLGWRFALYR